MEKFGGIEMRKMFGYPCTFLNGNMLTGLHEETWVLHLSEDDRAELSKKGALSQEILKTKDQLEAWIQRSINFVSKLPPK